MVCFQYRLHELPTLTSHKLKCVNGQCIWNSDDPQRVIRCHGVELVLTSPDRCFSVSNFRAGAIFSVEHKPLGWILVGNCFQAPINGTFACLTKDCESARNISLIQSRWGHGRVRLRSTNSSKINFIHLFVHQHGFRLVCATLCSI